MSEIAVVNPFEALGSSLRFGTTADGTPFVVGADFAAALGHRSAERAARLLDEDEKGAQIVGTPGGPQLLGKRGHHFRKPQVDPQLRLIEGGVS